MCAAPLDRREASHTHLRHVAIGASTTAPEKRACAAIESRARLADLAGRTSGGRDALLTRAARRVAASHRRESAVHDALLRQPKGHNVCRKGKNSCDEAFVREFWGRGRAPRPDGAPPLSVMPNFTLN